ncbi:TonB-dependent receptor plug domain-containing protein [Pelagicoccus albus]|uniref:TonB-dependent receptor plug domain-containing protein n=1 Tax=Pelagicoccus albus TaxID=415222 RepID=A0A7X1B6Y0_9BACT|nr:TonB-dependent receptor plug domain-containing protein [Pelagicoccus albus]MBC2606790.1 TonB-dependent receptor plug domain-containing protein [Pelagicoccus albus]
MNKSIKRKNRYTWSRSASGALALGAALLVAPLSSAQDEEEEVFELSPFSVQGDDNSGYRASSTLAGTRIRTDLKDVGSAISVVTEEFLRDTAATDNESLLIYTTGTEVGGINGNFAGGGDGGRVDTDAQRLRPNQATRVRGLAAADNTRDFFQTDIPWDSFNVDRIDLQRGPNSVLFGLGSPAGVINATTNAAVFENSGEAEIRVGSYGSVRGSIDYNKVIAEDEFAIRIAALKDDQKFMQDGAFEDDERYYVAMKWEPKMFQNESSSTTIKANFEKGEIDANRPRVIPPIDRITQWFRPITSDANTGMGKVTFDATTVSEQYTSLNSPDYSPYAGFALGRIFGSAIAIYDDHTSSTPSTYIFGGSDLVEGVYQGVLSYDAFAKNAIAGYGLPAGSEGRGLPGSNIGAYKSTTLSDPTIFDFYNKLIDGPNKSERQEWEAYDISFARTMLDNKLGFEVVYDVQQYEDRQLNLLDNAGQAISIDVMATIPDGTDDGMVNPNLGRPIIGGEAQNNYRNLTDRETFRFTGYYDVDFNESGSEQLGKILGRHVFTGVYSKSAYDQRSASWIRAVAENINVTDTITGGGRYIPNLVYLGPSLLDATSASGANLPALQNKLTPTDGTAYYLDADGNNHLGPIMVWDSEQGDIDNLYKAGNLSRDETDSKAFVWQGFLFDGMVVPTFGYREDTNFAANAGNVPDSASGIPGNVDPFSEDWVVPTNGGDTDVSINKTYVSASGINRTFSLVVHAPESFRDALGGMGVSLTYSDSQNFRPDASRRDLIGNPIEPTTGETKEYGIVLSSRDNRFNLKVNKYETKVYRDTLSDSSIANSYMIGAGEGWGNMYVTWATAGVLDFQRNFALTDPEGEYDAATNPYLDPEVTMLRYEPMPGQTPAEALASETAIFNAMLDRDNNLNDPEFARFLDFWNQDWSQVTAEAGWGASASSWAGEPGQFAITGDTVSEGWEYELFYQPTDNWNIALNASKTEAKRLNIAESYASFIEKRWELYQGPYGDVRLWGPGNSVETIRSKFGGEFYANYNLFQLLNDSNVAELRPWRFNLVSNYAFKDGKLAGLNVGGAMRWQDEVVVGYPIIEDAEGNYSFDTEDPFYGGSETNVDLWAAYSMPINDNVDWRIQLNVRNAFQDEKLIPITVQPDGSPATSRIVEGQSWTISNTFSF